VVAQLPQLHIHLPALERAPRHADGQEGAEQLRKEGDDVDAHGGGEVRSGAPQ
jgi:hypothetical protein